MDNHQIMDLARPLLGTLTQAQDELLSAIVDAVMQEIAAQIRPDVNPAECNDSLTLAAVLLSVSAMQKLTDSDISDFTAGTLKISFREDRSAFAETADRLLAPWRRNGFAFLGVSG